ncbi:MAG: O-antigen ligase family protein [Planctomycetota bacterium]|nr:O-antigen ligase family protein [Planctomycetota bacterium]
MALLVGAASLTLPDLFDANVFKTASLSIAAGVILLATSMRNRGLIQDAQAWFASGAGRLLVASTTIGALGSVSLLSRAAVVDRMLFFLLAQIAAILGWHASQRKGSSLTFAIFVAGFVTASTALFQAMGLEQRLTPGPEEIVALSGNSTRAGLLLGMTLPVAVAGLLNRAGIGKMAFCLTMLNSGALMLTLARGGRWAGALGTAMVIGIWWFRQTASDQAIKKRAFLCVMLAIAAGLALAWIVGGDSIWAAEKLENSASVFSGADPTTEVRLSLWRASEAMAKDALFFGHGLGRFGEVFPLYREAAEAALPGLGGAQTRVIHPHNELLLVLCESGAIGLCLWIGLLAATAWKAGQNLLVRPTSHSLAVGGILMAGLIGGMVQDGWTSPGTALPFFAALGWTWATKRDGTALEETPPILLRGGVVLFGLSLIILALPRLQTHLGMKNFYQVAATEGVNRASLSILAAAAESDPTDYDAQQLMAYWGDQYLAALEQVDAVALADLLQAIERAKRRVKSLAPEL